MQQTSQAIYAAQFATDGDHRTAWVSTATDNQALVVDLGSVQTIDRVRLNWGSYYARDLDVQVSSDGVTYTSVKAVTGNVPENHDNSFVNEYGQLAGQGRFVRVQCLTQSTPNGFSIKEIEVFSFTNTTPNLALAKPVKATDTDLSGTGFLFQPSFAVDGDPQTRWSTLRDTNQALVIDLGEIKQFTNVYIKWEMAYGVAFQLQVSADSTTWTTLATYTNNRNVYSEIGVAATGRYVRMLGQQGGRPGGGFSIYEMAVYNSPIPLAMRPDTARASISFYPNPTPNQATLEWNASAAGAAHYTLLNNLGQVVYTEQLSARPGHNKQALDLRPFAPGSYLLTLEADGQVLGSARVQKE
ncbi:MAG: discoidin domain-containing protein [Janthinobacterium lividum]